MDSIPSYYKYWGKTEKDTGRYHLLPYHCLDVAAVVAAWWDASPAIRHSFLKFANMMGEEQIRAWLLFFTALHDYGKFDIRFQMRSKQVWHLLKHDVPNIQMLPSENDCRNYYHGEAGLYWLIKDHPYDWEAVQSGQSSGLDFLDNPNGTACEPLSSWKSWVEAVMGHHGQVKGSEFIADVSLPLTCDVRLGESDRQARIEWIARLEQLFLKPEGLSVQDNPPSPSPILAGLCSVSDWLGSRCDGRNFSFQQDPFDLNAYFEGRCGKVARRIIEYAGVVARPHSYKGVDVLLAPSHKPHSVQTLVDDLPLSAGLTIVESPTGSGKTEAALSYAWRIIAAGLADSIVFALPTQATANAMLDRIERLATKLFNEHPNLLLAHGQARFNKSFASMKHAALEGYEKEDGWVQCSEWLAESRKRVFLGQIGVCTVDQVLISVLPVRHRFVRGFGLGRSVLIIDEVHAYDSYMYGLLEEVLRKQNESGGTAILLSATLPESQRLQLCEAWRAFPKESETILPYPLITWTKGHSVNEFQLSPDQITRELVVEIEPTRVAGMLPGEALLKRMITAAEVGAQVALVCNLVDVAQKQARQLRSMTSVPVDLYHARFCYQHRHEKELAVIHHFGPKGDRERGRILIATQVVEQSLDVDFDWLITQLCPVDLLFQRLGRLHRHDHHSRPIGFEMSTCTILLPEGDDYGIHSLIYANTRVLWRTAEMLLSAPDHKIVFPEAYRTWIKRCYQNEDWGNEPKSVEKGYEKFKTEIDEIKRYKARFMVDAAANPFADTDEHVTAITRDGEMNLILVPFCWTAQGRMLLNGEIFELMGEFERLESIALNSIGVPNSWRRYFEGPEEGRCWLEMEPDGEGYRGCSKGATFHYYRETGLERVT